MKINLINRKTVLDILNKEMDHKFFIWYKYEPDREWTFHNYRVSKRSLVAYDDVMGIYAIELFRYVPKDGGTVLYNENELYRQISRQKKMYENLKR